MTGIILVIVAVWFIWGILTDKRKPTNKPKRHISSNRRKRDQKK